MSKVLPSEWESPEHLSLSEREFLVDRAETINGIIVSGYLQVGQVLLQVKKKFKADPELNGWFKRWCDETLPFSYQQALQYARIAEECQTDPRIAEAAVTLKYSVLYDIVSTMAQGAKESMIQAILNGSLLTKRDIAAIKQTPEVELEANEALIEQLEATLLRFQLKGDSRSASKTKQRLIKALNQLQEKQAAVDSLEKIRSTQDLVLLQLNKQLKKSQVVIENMSLDPDQHRQRDLARTVVDATRSLDMLLSSIDRYSTDKPELGLQAIETIERKMEEVKRKLLDHHARTT